MISEGITPHTTVFQTQKEYLRTSIEQATASAHDLKEFEQLLLEKFNIRLKISRGRFSYIHPERERPITGRMLGTHYERDYILKLFEKNAVGRDQKEISVDTELYNSETKTSTVLQSYSVLENSFELLFMKSNLCLVVNLPECVKAQQSAPTPTR